MRRIWFWLSLALPVLLLGFILARVDLPTVARSLRGADRTLAAAAFVLAFLIPVLLLALRWQWILRRFYAVEVGFPTILAEYWLSIFVGYWVPAGVGSDVYRVVRIGKRAGGTAVNAAAIVGERFWALLVYGLLVLLTYPLVASSLDASPQVKIVVIQISTAAALGVVGLLIALTLKDSLARRLRSAVEGTIMDRLTRAARGLLRSAAAGGPEITFTTLFSPFFRWRNQALGLAMMAGIQLLTALGGRMLLLALGVDLSLAVHVFVWTLMNFFFLLPVSVAGFGVREASFILLFGLFGVSREAALAASFLSLFCTLLAIAPGGVVWIARALGQRNS